MLSRKTETQLSYMADFFAQNPSAMLYCTTDDDGVYLSFKTCEGEEKETFLGYLGHDIGANLYTFINRQKENG